MVVCTCSLYKGIKLWSIRSTRPDHIHNTIVIRPGFPGELALKVWCGNSLNGRGRDMATSPGFVLILRASASSSQRDETLSAKGPKCGLRLDKVDRWTLYNPPFKTSDESYWDPSVRVHSGSLGPVSPPLRGQM